MAKKKTRKRIVPPGPYAAMERTKKRLAYTAFHNAFMDAQRKREMARHVHSIMYDRISPGARAGAHRHIGPDALAEMFPHLG